MAHDELDDTQDVVAWKDMTESQKLDDLRDDLDILISVHHHERRRTIIYAALIAGLIALFIGRVIEVQGFNAQQMRSRTNCHLSQRGLQLTIDQLDEQADGILGDNSSKDGDPNEHLTPFRLTGTPFASFEPLVRAQARSNRARANEYRQLLVNCNVIFPDAKTLAIFQ